MVSMKATKCPKCGGIVFKLSGKASKLCHDLCLECRRAEAVTAPGFPNECCTHHESCTCMLSDNA